MRCYHLKYHHSFKETNHTAHVQDMQASGLSLVQSSYLDRGGKPGFQTCLLRRLSAIILMLMTIFGN